ncbi:response regulator [Tistlia consotensis]|uniref:response regulator n=1 Tax=Tistlia consotensis TaxID=1321365 RepID=UPI0013563795|nr:response regulator [Tistlia consotensis]
MAASRHATILLIDDEEDARDLLSACLRASGYRVLTAPDGWGAIERLAETPVDLVVTDVFMPRGDGLELIRAIRNWTRRLPILAISGGDGGGADMLPVARLLGADAALSKPFPLQDFRSQVADLLPAG